MHYINGTILGFDEPSNVVWEITEHNDAFVDDGITVSFGIYQNIDKRKAVNYLRDAIASLKIKWLSFKGGKWHIDLDHIKNEFGDFLFPIKKELIYKENTIMFDWVKREPVLTLDLLSGIVECQVEINNVSKKQTRINFILTTEYIMDSLPKKIFLSHKGVDKPRIRKFKITLQTLGFEPWFDEDAMPAGTQIERGLLKGFKDSCAAIFFVTPNYKDENYLEVEINYAISEKREKKSRFSIITLVFDEDKGKCIIPDLLKTYVWKTPKTDIEAIREIINALPIKVGNVEFKVHS